MGTVVVPVVEHVETRDARARTRVRAHVDGDGGGGVLDAKGAQHRRRRRRVAESRRIDGWARGRFPAARASIRIQIQTWREDEQKKAGTAAEGAEGRRSFDGWTGTETRWGVLDALIHRSRACRE